MAQIQGSGAGNWTNTAVVDATGRLWVDATISGTIIATNTVCDIKRVGVGSPSAWYGFSNLVNSVMIDNLGSNAIYYTFSGAVVQGGSETAYLDYNQAVSYELQAGSVNIQSSGNTLTEVQLLGTR